MKLSLRSLSLVLLAVAAGSCMRENQTKERPPLTFTPPAIPTPVTSDEEAYRHLALHYWDKFPFGDSLCIRQEGFADRAFSTYAELLKKNETDMAAESITGMLSMAGTSADDPVLRKEVLLKFFSLTEYFYYHPNSPYRDDRVFSAALEYMVHSPLLDTMDKQRHLYLLELSLKNRVGNRAENFSFVRAVKNFPYTDDPSSPETLYELKSGFLMILFINLGCSACQKTAREIRESALLSRMVRDKTLTILTIYPDRDLEGWQKYLPELPPEWIHGYDPGGDIRNGSLYDLKAIPSIYLLDRSARVLVKDALSVPQIEEVLSQEAYFL
jgi:hypothetical protein